ncbi:putative cyclophilin [Trypanosoma cruzi]|uniref:Cyclophilin, putative n=2 Tax=Trypanosoma cruzi TaxID=5693 RepID=Q4DI85_TRYCC|nr:cyclophilin, putative [Trypanosoma cruzi]EAN92229.1 cyclophilin, putative [Trypanosoma cruzi]KAF8297246.1 putative cyclophilin [Trypanosoma cruzi]PWV19051.1 putative cyclophilin [Trypanosoma cruzi]|eukprot:XP_814080.1 cyclophilin [Trypanosoma cruzi strain CL Brener]
MPSKRATRVQKLHEGTGDDNLPVFSIFIEKEGEGQYGRIDIEIFVNKVPKSCEIFLHSCPAALTGDKRVSKPSLVRQHRFLRLTNEGLQVGERPVSRLVSLSDIENEIGRVNHGIGVVSLCRSSNTFDESFFFCLTDNRTELESLDKRHTAFGRVVYGLELLFLLRDALIPYVKEGCVIEGSPYAISDILPKAAT